VAAQPASVSAARTSCERTNDANSDEQKFLSKFFFLIGCEVQLSAGESEVTLRVRTFWAAAGLRDRHRHNTEKLSEESQCTVTVFAVTAKQVP